MSAQDQFLDVIDRDQAEAKFRAALTLQPLGIERIRVCESLGRVLASNVLARVDVPSFDRSNFDGYAVRAADTAGVSEMEPGHLRLLPQSLEAGTAPAVEVHRGEAVVIATGGMVPRGADAILMVEHADERDGRVLVRRAVTPPAGPSPSRAAVA